MKPIAGNMQSWEGKGGLGRGRRPGSRGRHQPAQKERLESLLILKMVSDGLEHPFLEYANDPDIHSPY